MAMAGLCAAALYAPLLSAASNSDPLIGAFYYGDFHVDPQMSQIHGPNWTEFDVVLNAKPRYDGHLQPNVPMDAPGFGVSAPENDPTVMAAKIDAASSNGVDFFMFDWYWYASPSRGGIQDIQGKDGGVFLGGALNDGFLKAPNRNKLKFALMWANQDWVDIHPAKKGWHNTYRMPGTPYFGPGVAVQQLQMFDGYMTADVYRNAFKYITENYFSQPNYYKVPTKLANGSVASCCFFSFYQPEYIAMGNKTAGDELMDEFRAEALKAGQCLHLNHMGAGDSLIQTRGVNSVADYGWVKLGKSAQYAFPETPYEVVVEHALSTLASKNQEYAAKYGIPYVPSMSTAWDSSPRTLFSDSFGDFGYPWGTAWHSNVSQWASAAQRTIAQSTKLCKGMDWCPPILINAWNEWSEGAYLEPDQRYGWGRLQALKSAVESVRQEHSTQ